MRVPSCDLSTHIKKVPRWTAFFVHLHGPELKYHNASHSPVKDTYPTDRWQVGDHIEDVHEIVVPGDYPPGDYKVTMGFWGSSGTLPITGGGERVDKERRLVVGTLKIVAPPPPATLFHWGLPGFGER